MLVQDNQRGGELIPHIIILFPAFVSLLFLNIWQLLPTFLSDLLTSNLYSSYTGLEHPFRSYFLFNKKYPNAYICKALCPSVPLIACASTISELPPTFSYSSIIVSQRCFNTKQMMLHGKLYILHLSAFFPQLALLNLCQYVTKLHVYKYIYKITF